MNTIGWREDLLLDYKILKSLLFEMDKVTPEHDTKLNELVIKYKNERNDEILL